MVLPLQSSALRSCVFVPCGERVEAVAMIGLFGPQIIVGSQLVKCKWHISKTSMMGRPRRIVASYAGSCRG